MKKISLILLVLASLTISACGPNPIDEARAHEIEVLANSTVESQEQQREIKREMLCWRASGKATCPPCVCPANTSGKPNFAAWAK